MVTRFELKNVMRWLSKRGASKGGHARAQSLTAAQRSESARIAGSAPKRKRRKA